MFRFWFEVDINRVNFTTNHYKNISSKWVPLNKGGPYRRWYGNMNFITDVKFCSNAENEFNKAITWSDINSHYFSARIHMEGSVANNVGKRLYIEEKYFNYVLGYFNSVVVNKLLDLIIPTLHFDVGYIGKLPLIFTKDEHLMKKINRLVENNINISKTDWDSFETSWDFKKHPLLTHKGNATTIEEAFNNWADFAEKQFNQLKASEEELNRIFIEIYGLQDELTPEVDDKDITIRKADRERDIKSFISYAVGCMFGRYSLDEEGLIYAGGDFKEYFRCENGAWQIKTKEGWKESSIDIAGDNVIPIADGDYFEDDSVNQFVEFVKAAFGEETLEENLDYIAETLGKKSNETSRQAIRRYFLKDFYKDHVKTYKKRPIYWLFDSGKENGFKSLIYMHRYDPFTVARVRTDYLHKLQKKHEAEINHLDILIDSDISEREKAAARKRKEKIIKQIMEYRVYDQAIAHVANQKIEIDLDDGVKVNYAKFQGIEIPQGEGKKPLKADLLAKI